MADELRIATDEEVAEAFEATIEAELDDMMEELENTELSPERKAFFEELDNAKTPEERSEVIKKYYPNGLYYT